MTDSQLKSNFTYNFGSSEEIVANLTNLYLNAIVETLSGNATAVFNDTAAADAKVLSTLPHPCEYFDGPTAFNFNCTKDAYVQYHRGPQQLPIVTALAVSILLFFQD